MCSRQRETGNGGFEKYTGHAPEGGYSEKFHLYAIFEVR